MKLSINSLSKTYANGVCAIKNVSLTLEMACSGCLDRTGQVNHH